MKKNTLSVIIPNYNHGQYIGEALEAILKQSFQPLEVIVADDGSTDNSIDVIKGVQEKYPNVRLLRNEKNMGAIYAANRCLSEAKGDYIYPASSDDRVLPGFFEESMDMLSKYPDAGLCCSSYRYLDDDKIFYSKQNMNLHGGTIFLTPEKLAKYLSKKYFNISAYSSIIKRSNLLEAGGFIPELIWAADGFALLTVAFRKGICYIDKPFAVARISPASYSRSTKDMRVYYKVLCDIMDRFKSPSYSDVLPLIKKSKVISVDGIKLLNTIIAYPRHKDFINLRLFKYVFKDIVASITPISIKNIYRRIFGR